MDKGYTITFSGEMSFYEEDEGKAMRYFWDKLKKAGLGMALVVDHVKCEPFVEEEDQV